MNRLRLITGNGFICTNCCWYQTENGTPMVGSTYCQKQCPNYRGKFRFLFWNFVKCKYWK